MREDHPADPHRDREQMQEEREFDSLVHGVFLSDYAAPLKRNAMSSGY